MTEPPASGEGEFQRGSDVARRCFRIRHHRSHKKFFHDRRCFGGFVGRHDHGGFESGLSGCHGEISLRKLAMPDSPPAMHFSGQIICLEEHG
jgi:hypothetical protein